MIWQFQRVVLGGTFDVLHSGHKKLLEKSFTVGKFVSIGLTSDSFNKQRGKVTYDKFPQRLVQLDKFLHKFYPKRYKIIPINDIYGNANTDLLLEAVIVSPETVSNAEKINFNRSQHQLNILKIISVPHLTDLSGEIITSTRIRQGEIDSEGKNFLNFLLSISGRDLKEDIKNKLKQPLGKLIQKPPKKNKATLSTVGDITTQNFLKAGITPQISIIDFNSRRQQVFSDLTELGFPPAFHTVTSSNPSGTISRDVIKVIFTTLGSSQPTAIQVKGEEDLTLLPLLLLSPLGNKIYYGQPSQGIVELVVTPTSKQKIWKILNS